MQNGRINTGNSLNQRVESGEFGGDFFEQHGLMPNNDPRRSENIGNAAINGLETQTKNVNSLGEQVESYFEQPIRNEDINMAVNDTAGTESGVRRDFSKGKNFTKSDNEITEAQIRKLKEDPAAAYEEIQADREAYLKQSFGRILGEQQ